MRHNRSVVLRWLPLALLVACDRKPDLPRERAAEVEAARDDVKSAQRDLARADTPAKAVGASNELSAAGADFQKKRDAAVQAVQDTLGETDQDIRHLVATRGQVEFQDVELERKTDAAIKELATARTDLERELAAMRQATVDTWSGHEERVTLLTARIRDLRQRVRDLLY